MCFEGNVVDENMELKMIIIVEVYCEALMSSGVGRTEEIEMLTSQAASCSEFCFIN